MKSKHILTLLLTLALLLALALPGGVFAGCESLLAVAVPPSVTEIDPDALFGAKNAVVLGVAGSAAERFAAAQGLDFLPLEADFFA